MCVVQSQYSGVKNAAAPGPAGSPAAAAAAPTTKLAYAQLDLSAKSTFKIPTNVKYVNVVAGMAAVVP
jgi:hypothetical protein